MDNFLMKPKVDFAFKEIMANEKAILDYNQAMKEAKETGWEAGREIGREEGEKIGEQRGKEKSREQINRLNALLIQDERYNDLQKSVKDYEFQKQLMSEYGIN